MESLRNVIIGKDGKFALPTGLRKLCVERFRNYSPRKWYVPGVCQVTQPLTNPFSYKLKKEQAHLPLVVFPHLRKHPHGPGAFAHSVPRVPGDCPVIKIV